MQFLYLPIRPLPPDCISPTFFPSVVNCLKSQPLPLDRVRGGRFFAGPRRRFWSARLPLPLPFFWFFIGLEKSGVMTRFCPLQDEPKRKSGFLSFFGGGFLSLEMVSLRTVAFSFRSFARSLLPLFSPHTFFVPSSHAKGLLKGFFASSFRPCLPCSPSPSFGFLAQLPFKSCLP